MNDKNKKPPETEEDVFNIFLDLFNEVAPESPQEVDEFLRENGYNPDELAQNARSAFKDALEKSPLNWRNRARQGIEDTKAKIAQQKQKSGLSREEIIASITRIQQKQGSAIAAHFRSLDLDKVTDEELVSMLADLEYLETEDAEQDE